jgi:hypothetical protein
MKGETNGIYVVGELFLVEGIFLQQCRFHWNNKNALSIF